MKKVEYELICDIDKKTAIATIPFTYGGHNYEIDLCEADFNTMENTFDIFIEHARRVSSTPMAKRRNTKSRKRSAAIREWAVDAGYNLNDKGRLPDYIVAAYNAR